MPENQREALRKPLIRLFVDDLTLYACVHRKAPDGSYADDFTPVFKQLSFDSPLLSELPFEESYDAYSFWVRHFGCARLA